MIKDWKTFLKEEFIENSNNIIDVKMEELNDLISGFSDGNDIMYQWENKDDNEVIINFLFNDISNRYEINLNNSKVDKIKDNKVIFSLDVYNIDEALDIVEKDIHEILGVSESKTYDSSLTKQDVLWISKKIKKVTDLKISDSANIEGLVEEIEDGLKDYDLILHERVTDMILFDNPDSTIDEVCDRIIKLGDKIMDRHGTEPKMVIQAFEDAFNILEKHYKINEKNTPTDKKLWDKALRLVKGTKHGGSASVRVNGKKYDAPNNGKGFTEYPSAYSNSFAAKMYKKWGGGWKKTNEDLRDWHDEKWVRVDTSGNITGECGSMKNKDNPSRCLPKKKAQKMSKKDRASTARKKKNKGKTGKQFVANTKKAKVSNKDRKNARS